MNGILEYIPGNSIIHKANPITKLALALSICIACFLTDNLFVLLGLLVVDMCIGIIGGAHKKAFGLLKTLGKASIFLFVLQVLVTRKGEPVFFFITDVGLISGVKICLRLMDATIPLILVLAMTQMTDLANAMVSVLHLPYKYAFTLITSMKFIPLFFGEMRDIMEAQTARGVEFDAKGIAKKMKLILPMCVPLLLTSVRKADANAMAVEVRGFYLRNRKSAYKKYGFGLSDLILFLCLAGIIAVSILV